MLVDIPSKSEKLFHSTAPADTNHYNIVLIAIMHSLQMVDVTYACDISWRMPGYADRMKAEMDENPISIQTMADLMVSNYQELERAYAEKDKRNDCSRFSCENSDSVITGFTEFDSVTGGLNCGELIVLAGSPWANISTVAMKIAVQARTTFEKTHSIQEPMVCLFAPLNSSAEMCSMNALSVESGVPLHILRSGGFSSTDWRKLATASGVLAESSVHMTSVTVMTVQKLMSGIRAFVQTTGNTKLVVVDGFDQMNKYSDVGKREAEFSEIVGSLKCLAAELNLALMVTVSLASRFLHPELEDLEAYSKSVYEGADTVVFLHADRTTIELHVAKHQGWVAA